MNQNERDERGDQEIVLIILLLSLVTLLPAAAYGVYCLYESYQEKIQTYKLESEEKLTRIRKRIKEEKTEDLKEVYEALDRYAEQIQVCIPRRKRSSPYLRVDTRGLSEVEAAVKIGIAYLPYIEKTWGELVDRIRIKNGFTDVDRDLVLAHMAIESKGERYALSDSGAIGLMQVMPSTAIMYGCRPRDLVKPHINVYCGIRHIHEAKKKEHIQSQDWLIASYWTGYGKKSYDYSQKVEEAGYKKMAEYCQKVSGVLDHLKDQWRLENLFIEEAPFRGAEETKPQTVATDDRMFF